MTSIDLPRLPPEIEIQIFRYAIRHSFQDVGNLILVAQRVYEWLIPEVFKVVIHTHPKTFPLRQLSIDTFKRYGIHVKHFCIAKDHYTISQPDAEMSSAINQYLESSPNLINLFINWNMPISTMLLIGGHPSITRLTTPTKHLLGTLTQDGVSNWHSTTINTHDSPRIAFPRITHLRLTYWIPDQALIETLAYHIPALTHIAIPAGESGQSSYEQQVKKMLEVFRELKILIIWRGGELGVARERDEIAMGWDKRVAELVSNTWGDWEVGAKGTGLDIWEFAEKVIGERRVIRG